MVPSCCGWNYATVSHVSIQILNVVVLPVIVSPHNDLTPHISKTHLAIISLNLRKLELN